MMLTVLNSSAKYDISGEPRRITDEAIGEIVIGRDAAVISPPSYDEAVKFIERPNELNVEEVLKILNGIKGLFIGNPSRLEDANKCWKLIKLAGKLIEDLEPSTSWCSCIGLTNYSLEKRVAFERIPTPELALSGNVVIGVGIFNSKCRRIEFRDVPLIKFDKPSPPASMVDALAQMIEVSVGDVVANLEGVVEDLAKSLNSAIKEEVEKIMNMLKEGVENGVVYVEIDKLSEEMFNRVCKKIGQHILTLREEAKKRLMI